MKVEIQKLSEALRRIKFVGHKRSTLPVLSCVRIAAVGGTLEIIGSDLDQYQCERIECEGMLAACCVNFGALLNCCFGAGDMTIEFNESELIVGTPNGEFILDILDAEEFPEIRKLEKAKNIGVNCLDLAKGIDATGWAASVDIGRYILNSAHLIGKPKSLTIEATDGVQLAVNESAEICGDFDAVAPSGMLGNLSEALKRSESQLVLSDNWIRVEYAGGWYQVKQLEGVYLSTKTITSGKQEKIGSIEIQPFIEAVSRCNFFATPDRMPLVRLSFSNSGVRIELVGLTGAVDLTIPGQFKEHVAMVDAGRLVKALRSFDASTCDLFSAKAGEAPIFMLSSGDYSVRICGAMANFQMRKKKATQLEL